MQINRLLLSSATLLSLFMLGGCDTKDNPITTSVVTSDVVLKNHSVTPALIKLQPGFETMQVYSILSSDDKLDGSPNFVFGGSADGAGLLKNADGTFTMLVNHEDNFAVSRVTLDKTFKPTKGEYLLNSDGGTWRLCSATMATQQEHGFGPMYLTSGESGEDSRTHGLEPFGSITQAAVSRELPALGRTSAEVALPLPKTAYAGKTAIVIGDDDSGVNGGQVYLYLANTVGDLQNGDLYVLKRRDSNQKERDIVLGQTYDVDFVKVENQKTITGLQQNVLVDQTLKAIKFGRVEDVDYRKDGVGREVYFNVTGQATTGTNADFSRTKYGRVYKLVMDAANPLVGKLSVVLDGDDRTGKAKLFQNPDNICATKNYVYVQEDPNSYGDETHDGYIYQYNIATGDLKVVMELDHRRTAADAAKYNVGGQSRFGQWEYGALIDVSQELGMDDTFLLYPQPHTWLDAKYQGVDGGARRNISTDATARQGSQVLVIKGLPR